MGQPFAAAGSAGAGVELPHRRGLPGRRGAGALSLPAWSDGGTHYTVFYAYLFLVPAFLLGQRFRGQLFARTGGWFAGFLLAAFTLLYVLIGV